MLLEKLTEISAVAATLAQTVAEMRGSLNSLEKAVEERADFRRPAHMDEMRKAVTDLDEALLIILSAYGHASKAHAEKHNGALRPA